MDSADQKDYYQQMKDARPHRHDSQIPAIEEPGVDASVNRIGQDSIIFLCQFSAYQEQSCNFANSDAAA